jgi:ElaB/YqjD/DUF883 family membrane-anchored ribosome-binding protein
LAAGTKGENHATHDSLKALRSDFERRIRDIGSEMEQGHVGMAEESLAALRNEFERRLSDMREQMDESMEPRRQAIRDQPFSSVAAALASGVAAGVLLGVLLTSTKSKK